MALSRVISEAWDQRLENWARWRKPFPAAARDVEPSTFATSAETAAVSSAYDGEAYRTGYRTSTIPVMLGDALDVDTMMERLRRVQATKHLYDALEMWAAGKGTRAMQARLLAVSERTFYYRVDAGKELLQAMRRRPNLRKPSK